jgi:hypothetical protein
MDASSSAKTPCDHERKISNSVRSAANLASCRRRGSKPYLWQDLVLDLIGDELRLADWKVVGSVIGPKVDRKAN